MHEHALIRDLLRKVDRLARAEDARRVTAVRVRLGALSHLSAAHVRAHFEDAAKGTIAEKAALEIEESGDIYDADAQELKLQSIEVET